jgi:uncharacterized protein (DUF1697 family)
MTAIRYLALLRGINVGGKNIIKMADLKKCFEDMGFNGVTTFIQSGNVVFGSEEKNADKLAAKIEKGLSEKFNYPSRIVLVSNKQLKAIIDDAPKGFGKKPEAYRYDVVFLKEPLGPAEAMKQVQIRSGIETASAGKHTLYFSRLISKAIQGRLVKIISLPAYQSMTIRNWNTANQLLSMMQK